MLATIVYRSDDGSDVTIIKDNATEEQLQVWCDAHARRNGIERITVLGAHTGPGTPRRNWDLEVDRIVLIHGSAV